MSHRTVAILLLALAAPLPAAAQSHAILAPPSQGAGDNGWSGRGEVGLAMAKGNTDSESFIGKLDFDYSDPRHKFAIGASAQYAQADGSKSARRYETHGSSGFRLSERSYIYGALRSERDNFASYEYQWTATAGYGYEAILGDDHRLFFEIGPGYRFAKDQGTRVHHNQAIGRGMADWNYKLTDTTSLVDTLLVESGSDNTFARNLLGVRVAVNESMAMKAGLETRYNSHVDAGIENTDQLTTVNLVYNFK